MAFNLCGLKAFAFAAQMGYSKEQVELLRRFSVFSVKLYAVAFLESSIGSDAAVNDLQLFGKISAFKSVDRELAEEADKILQRHLWYLTDIPVMFALFSDKVELDTKSKMAVKLLSFDIEKENTEVKLEKPRFPEITEDSKLEDFLTPKSLQFFSILGFGHDWLSASPDTWELDPDFFLANSFVKSVKVTNDTGTYILYKKD